jgi:FkbH-like protein
MPARDVLRSLFIDAVATLLRRVKHPRPLLDEIARRVERERLRRAEGFAAMRSRHNGAAALTPTDLRVTELAVRRVLVVGSCLAETWAAAIPVPTDFVLTNDLNELPAAPPQPADAYDVQIVQLPLRWPMPDAQLWHVAFADSAAYAAELEASIERMRVALALACAWNVRYGLPTLVTNFFVPQQNALGRLFPRYDLRNPAYFVEQLNAALEREIAGYEDAYLFDVDGLAAALGRAAIQDDSVTHLSHGSLLGDCPANAADAARIEPPAAMSDHYLLSTGAFLEAMWQQALAMLRTLARTDEVKLVIVDLDDTLWRGVAGEGDLTGSEAIEGWPLGVAEALCILKRRGILLAIVSKNDEGRIRERWDSVFAGRLSLDDFAVVRIDWRPKVENVTEVLAAVNVLPRNTLFIDDNPVERAAIRMAFPDVRVLGEYPYYLRRVLLWSSETQVSRITNESGRRTEMVQAQVRREGERRTMSRDAFLQTLDIRVTHFVVADGADPQFERLAELINKTNQFNTTGRRWKREELLAAMRDGLELHGFAVIDRFADYGVVGAVLVNDAAIVQFVMSCRVIGLDVEKTVLDAIVTAKSLAGFRAIHGTVVATDANFVAREVFARAGFSGEGNGWVRTIELPAAV